VIISEVDSTSSLKEPRGETVSLACLARDIGDDLIDGLPRITGPVPSRETTNRAGAIALCSATEKADAPSCENRTFGFLPASQRGVSSARVGQYRGKGTRIDGVGDSGQVSRCLRTRWAEGADSIRSPNTAQGIIGIVRGAGVWGNGYRASADGGGGWREFLSRKLHEVTSGRS